MTRHKNIKADVLTVNRRYLKAISGLAALVVFYVILSRSDTVSSEIYTAMKDSALVIIPSLFPLMILSRFICNYGLLEFYGKITGKVMSKLFNVSPKASGSILIGLLSSFPLGTMTVCDLYKRGIITKDEAETALGPAHSTGPAFPIAVIGTGIMKSYSYGTGLYLIQILSLLITSKLLNNYDLKNIEEREKIPLCTSDTYDGFAGALTDAVCKSADGCVNIIGFISLGKLIIRALSSVIPMKPVYMTITSALIEFSSGCAASADLGGGVGFALCSFGLCFGGIVSLLQAASYTSKTGLKIKKCILFKLIQGIISMIISYCVYYIIF